MTQSSPPPNPPAEESKAGIRGWAKGLLVVELFALAVALVTPITPSKTDSTWTPAQLFSPDSPYLEEVAASFLLVNALLLSIGLVVWITSRFSKSGKNGGTGVSHS